MLYKSLHHDIRAIDKTQHVNLDRIPTIFGRTHLSPMKSSLKASRSKTQIGLQNETSSSLNKNKKVLQLLDNHNHLTQNMRQNQARFLQQLNFLQRHENNYQLNKNSSLSIASSRQLIKSRTRSKSRTQLSDAHVESQKTGLTIQNMFT